jgi:hypothetical protein
MSTALAKSIVPVLRLSYEVTQQEFGRPIPRLFQHVDRVPPQGAVPQMNELVENIANLMRAGIIPTNIDVPPPQVALHLMSTQEALNNNVNAQIIASDRAHVSRVATNQSSNLNNQFIPRSFRELSNLDSVQSDNSFPLPQNIKNFFSASFGWFAATVTNVFSRVGVGEHDNHSDSIAQSDDHSFSWANSISNLGLLFNTISNLLAYLWPEQVSPELVAAELSQDNLNSGLLGEERSESE